MKMIEEVRRQGNHILYEYRPSDLRELQHREGWQRVKEYEED